MADVTLDSIRQKYPQYQGVADDDLARALHAKFYSNVPFADFAQRVGYNDAPELRPNAQAASAPPAATGFEGFLNRVIPGRIDRLEKFHEQERQAMAAHPGATLDSDQTAGELFGGMGKSIASGALHAAGNLGDIFINAAHTLTGNPDQSHLAEDWSSLIPPSRPTTGDFEAQDNQKALGRGYDKVFGTGPLAQTVKEAAPQAAEGIATVAGLGEAAPSVVGRFSRASEAALRAPVGEAGEAFQGAKAVDAASARNMAAASPQVDPGLLDRTGFRTGSGQGVAKAVAGEDAGPALQKHNQAIGNTVLSGEANVPTGTQLSYDATKAGREGPNSVYDRTARTLPEGPLTEQARAGINSAGQPDGGRMTKGSPQAQTQIQALRDQLLDPAKSWNGQQLVNEVRGLRQEGFKNIASDDVSNQELGRAQLDMSRAIEGHIEATLPPNGPVSLQQLRDARKALAKNYAVEGALKGSDVDLKAIARLQRADPELLDGGLKDVADFANSREGSAVVGIPNPMNESSLAGRALDAVDLHRPVKGVARLLGGATARKALVGDTAAAVDAAVARYGAKPGRFDPQPGLTPPPGRAGRDPVQTSLGDLAQGPGPAPWTLEEGASPSAGKAQPRQGDIPLADLLSHGVEKAPPPGLSVGPMEAPKQEGVPFKRDAVHEAGDLSLADPNSWFTRPGPSNSDVPAVRSQGVPDGTVTRAPQRKFVGDTVDFPSGTERRRVIENNASGESAASLEAMRRGTRDLEVIDPDGVGSKLLRDVTQIDRSAPKGHIIVDAKTGEIIDRGGLNQRGAEGLRNRWASMRKLGDTFAGVQ